jgi:predicted RND superfamily exporter protein
VLPRLSLETHPERLAAGLPALADARHAERVLGSSGEIDVVLRGDDVLRPESLAWLRAAEDRAVVRYGNRLQPILSAPDLLRFLGPSPSRAQVEAALRLLPSYLTGAVVREDGREAVISFGAELDDLDDQRALVAGLRASLPPPPRGQQVAVTGLPVAAARGYELVSSGRYAVNLTGIAAAGVVLFVGLRRRSDALRAVGSAALATGVGLLALSLTGVPLTPVTVALGSLTAAVGCEFAVLLTVARRRDDPSLRRSVFLAAGMSALGYAVLALSALSVIRQFGLVLATSVVLALFAAICVTSTVPSGPPLRRNREAHDKTLVGVA